MRLHRPPAHHLPALPQPRPCHELPPLQAATNCCCCTCKSGSTVSWQPSPQHCCAPMPCRLCQTLTWRRISPAGVAHRSSPRSRPPCPTSRLSSCRPPCRLPLRASRRCAPSWLPCGCLWHQVAAGPLQRMPQRQVTLHRHTSLHTSLAPECPNQPGPQSDSLPQNMNRLNNRWVLPINGRKVFGA